MNSVDYHPSRSGLTSRIHTVMFLQTPQGFFSPKCLSKFLSNLYILPWLGKISKFMMLRLLKNVFASQNFESRHLYSCLPQAKLSLRLRKLMFFPLKGTILCSFVVQFIRQDCFIWVSSWHLFTLKTAFMCIFSLILNHIAWQIKRIQYSRDDTTGQEIKKQTNKQTGFREIFLKPKCKCVAGVSTTYFKISYKQNPSKMKGVATTLCFL